MSYDGAQFLGRSVRAFLEGFLEGPTKGESRDACPPDSSKDFDDDEAPFPSAGIDAFLSHFVFTIRINKGDAQGEIFSYTWPAAIQSVARSEPFIYRGRSANHSVEFPLPKASKLARRVSEEDFLTTPPGFFQPGKETIFLQILNLDARGETPFGPMRCILGETFKREYPDIFQPSFGAAQSLRGKGLPGKLFFVPNGIFETPFGALHTRPKALLGSRISSVPPIGSSPSLLEAIPLDSVDDLRAARKKGIADSQLEAAATLVALAHPIDALLFETGDPAFESVERAIARPG
jgi:hypothetical protein